MLNIFLKCSGLISCLSKNSASNTIYSSFDGQGLHMPEGQHYDHRSALTKTTDAE